MKEKILNSLPLFASLSSEQQELIENGRSSASEICESI
jgi:hypothetical protein